MPITVNHDCMRLETDRTMIVTASDREDGQWVVTCWARWLRRNQAISVLTVPESSESGSGSSDVVVVALWMELLP
jgi:hypothetical protein